MADDAQSLEVILSEEELDRVITGIKDIVNNGLYTRDWTYASNNPKNRSFIEKYICGEDEYRSVINKLSPAVFYEAEKNNSPRARRDANAAKEIMYKFITEEVFALRYPDEVEEEKINIYIKITFPGGSDDNIIIVSFHESLRDLEEELENKIATRGQI